MITRCFFAVAMAGLGVTAVLLTGCSDEGSGTPHVSGVDRIAAGRYVLDIGGCNDCHTAGWMQGEQVPEDKRYLGVQLGWRGPWGTTYAPNLRLTVKDMPMEEFVRTMSKRTSNPPMPWSALHAMSTRDLQSVYMYLTHLGPAGERMPVRLPPGVEPSTPYIDATPKMPAKP